MALIRDDIADIIRELKLSESETEELLFCCNLLGTVDSAVIHEYAGNFTKWKGDSYQVAVQKKSIPDGMLYAIEPICGSTTYVLDTGLQVVVVDTGFPCYQEELKSTLCSLIDNFEKRNPVLILTHMDMDHTGLLSCFSRIYLSKDSYDDFVKRKSGLPNFRESVEKRCPYYRITSILSRDAVADTDTMIPLSPVVPFGNKPLTFLGKLELPPFSFEVYQTSGGHVEGSIILFERKNRLVFAGDTYVNPDMSEGQRMFILNAMKMLGSLNADSAKAKEERRDLFEMMGDESWVLCGGHGSFSEYPLKN